MGENLDAADSPVVMAAVVAVASADAAVEGGHTAVCFGRHSFEAGTSVVAVVADTAAAGRG